MTDDSIAWCLLVMSAAYLVQTWRLRPWRRR
jgi:hypothetical protein